MGLDCRRGIVSSNLLWDWIVGGQLLAAICCGPRFVLGKLLVEPNCLRKIVGRTELYCLQEIVGRTELSSGNCWQNRIVLSSRNCWQNRIVFGKLLAEPNCIVFEKLLAKPNCLRKIVGRTEFDVGLNSLVTSCWQTITVGPHL